jgi:cytoskeletal protein CcmA (bactofilin family)
MMKFGNRSSAATTIESTATDLRSFLGEGTSITGEIKFTEIMRVDAEVNGTITSDNGSLLVMEKGRVKATVQAGTIEVSGIIEGTVTARNGVKIHPTGRVYGDIYTSSLIIENGAVFDGKCHMNDGKSVSKDSKPIVTDAKGLKTADAV